MLSPAQRSRLLASGIHLLVSAVLAALTASLVLGVWYPPPYTQLSGGLELLWLLVGVDLVIGPLLTLVIFNVAKPRAELMRDVAIIAVVQAAALVYGLYTTAEARPVALVFEQDRFRVIPANDLMASELPQALPEFRRLSWLGPVLISTRQPRSSDEKLSAIELALRGYDVGQRPSFWIPYDQTRRQALEMARPIAALLDHYPKDAPRIRAELAAKKLAPDSIRFLPLQAKKGDWVVYLDPAGSPVGFAPFDGFF